MFSECYKEKPEKTSSSQWKSNKKKCNQNVHLCCNFPCKKIDKKINLNLCRRRNALEKKRKQTFTHTHSLITIQILTITKSETNGVT